jgi:hypothetical protein
MSASALIHPGGSFANARVDEKKIGLVQQG